MSARRRQRRVRFRSGDLTLGQQCELADGIVFFAGETGFSSVEELEEAWWKHRDILLEECRPLERPFAYWAFEARGRDLHEDQADSLLRLNLPLRPQEHQILLNEPPPHTPTDGILPAYANDWRKVCRSIEIRAAWHRREGRIEQADQWNQAFESLRIALEKLR